MWQTRQVLVLRAGRNAPKKIGERRMKKLLRDGQKEENYIEEVQLVGPPPGFAGTFIQI